MTTMIRGARPDDAPFLARTDLIASRGHVDFGIFDLAFPDSEELRLRYLELMAVSERRSFHHYSRFLVAEVDGTPAAALCGYTENKAIWQAMEEARKEVLPGLGIGAGDWEVARERMAPALTCPYPPAAGAWSVEWVGCLPEYRRRGLVNALLEAILDEGRRTGHTLAEIAVLIGNEPAQGAYEKAGFVAYEDIRHPDFERVMRGPGMRKLRRML
jgi:ribosomal protein S18 acetylase RimI-like enzyme